MSIEPITAIRYGSRHFYEFSYPIFLSNVGKITEDFGGNLNRVRVFSIKERHSYYTMPIYLARVGCIAGRRTRSNGENGWSPGFIKWENKSLNTNNWMDHSPAIIRQQSSLSSYIIFRVESRSLPCLGTLNFHLHSVSELVDKSRGTGQ